MIKIGFHISFLFASLILAYQDIQSRTVSLGIYMITILLGCSYAWWTETPFMGEHMFSIPAFIGAVLFLWGYKRIPVIAWADIVYMILILFILQGLWAMYFVMVGLTALSWQKFDTKNRQQPFIAIMLVAYILTIGLEDLEKLVFF